MLGTEGKWNMREKSSDIVYTIEIFNYQKIHCQLLLFYY